VRISFDQLIVYAVGVLLMLVGLFKRSNSRRSRDISGNVVIGNNAGTVSQSYRTASASEARPPAPDRVAWVIAIVGVLVAAAQLAYDLFWAK
jgi:hypothetical protein